jgi:aspartate/methionine/tyrosine aminotransferase
VAFSKRSNWSICKNRLALALEAKRQAGSTILDLTESNPTRAGFEYPAEEILGSLSRRASLLYEPHPQGLEAARLAVCAYYSQRGVAIRPEQLVLTSSTSEAYAHLFRLLGDPGDNFLTPRPSYPLFEYLAGLENIELRPYRLLYDDGWYMDLHSLEEAVSESTRAILMVNPNNPTGSFLKRDELLRLREIARRHYLAWIVDEVFFDYPLQMDPSSIRSLADEQGPLTFVLNGLSKMSALPQVKLAWILVCGPQEEKGKALERLELIADTFLSVGTPVQHAAATLLEARNILQPQIRKRLQNNLRLLNDELALSPARALRVEGGWYAVVQVPRTRSEEEWVVDLLENHDVLVHPGFFFDIPSEAFLVFSLLTPTEIFHAALQRFKACLSHMELVI